MSSSVELESKIKQLKNGSFLLLWNIDLSDTFESSKTFQCEDHQPIFKVNYKYLDYGMLDSQSFSIEDPTFTISLQFINKDLPSEQYPVTVTAFLEEDIKEMTRLENKDWAEVKWNYDGRQENLYSSYDVLHKIAHLGLLLEFQPTPENCTTIQYSKVLDYLTTADLNVVVQGRIFPVHAALLIAASPVMAAMLDSTKSEEGRMKAVEISDMDPEVFQQLLCYISTGSAPRLAEEFITENLFMIADKYLINRLKAECEKQMCCVLKMDNAIKYLVAAYVHSAPTLQEASMLVLVEHSKELWDLPEFKELSVTCSDLFYLVCRRIVESDDKFVVGCV